MSDEHIIISNESGSFEYKHDNYQKFIDEGRNPVSLRVYYGKHKPCYTFYKVDINKDMLQYAPWKNKNNTTAFIEEVVNKINQYNFYSVDFGDNTLTYKYHPNIHIKDIQKIILMTNLTRPYHILEGMDCATHSTNSIKEEIGIPPTTNSSFKYLSSREITGTTPNSLDVFKNRLFRYNPFYKRINSIPPNKIVNIGSKESPKSSQSPKSSSKQQGGTKNYVHIIDKYGTLVRKRKYIIDGKVKVCVKKGKYVSITTFKNSYLNKNR